MSERPGKGDHEGTSRSPGIVAAVAAWRRELSQLGGPEPLMRPTDLHEGSLDLAVAHPSGIAMLLAGRPTRLSHLFREPGVLDAAQRQARAIRASAAALADEHGLRACVLAVGLASWREDRSGEVVSTPILLRPVQLRPRSAGPGGGVDYEVDLGGPVRTNPALVRELARRGIPLDAQGLASLSVHSHGFDPTPALERLRSLIAVGARDLTVRQALLVTALVDVAPALVAALDAAADHLADSDVVASLAGDPAARQRLHASEAGGADDVDDVLVVPVDTSQRAVLGQVLAGRSLRVEAGPGTGTTQLVAATVAALAGRGRRVLLVAGQQVEVADVARTLSAAGLADLVVDPTRVPDVPTDRPVTGQLMTATAPGGRESPTRASGDSTGPTGGATDPRREPGAGAEAGPRTGPGAGAVQAGRDLLAADEALHIVRRPWGVSALEVIQALTALPAPAGGRQDSVRLPEAALAGLDAPARQAAAAQLREAVELGALTTRVEQTPWTGAALSSPQEAAQALAAVRALVEDLLPSLRRQAAALASGSGLREASCVADCVAQLELFTAARDTLDAFGPAVFDRSLAPLVEATEPPSARVTSRLGFWERRRLERDARDLLRPGVVPTDLHAALVAAEDIRTAWARWAPDAAVPRVPHGVPTAEVVLEAVMESLAGLEHVLAPTSAGGDLLATGWHDLERRLVALASHAEALEDLPRRTALLASLTDRGLAPLLDDLRRRQVPPGEVWLQLERAWWRSVLDVMVEQDEALRPISAEQHAALVADLAVGERARTTAAVQRVRRVVTAAMADGSAPCRVSSPLALPHELEEGDDVDVVVLVAAHRIGVPEAVIAAQAARQVLVIGNPGGLSPARVEPRTGARPRPPRVAALDAFQGVLPTVTLQWQHRMPAQLAEVVAVVPDVVTGSHAVPCVPGRRPLRVRVAAEVTGRPDEDGVVESPDGEVAAVVDVVAHHARSHPEESLAVIALSRPHARRVADALRTSLRTRPELADFLTRRGREAFVVTDLERCEDTVRDAVVLTVGFGLTPLGRFVHRFGPLDEPGGHRGLAVALTRARTRLTAVTCVAGVDLEDERLRSPGSRALRDVLVAMDAAAAVDARGGLAAAGAAVVDLREVEISAGEPSVVVAGGAAAGSAVPTARVGSGPQRREAGGAVDVLAPSGGPQARPGGAAGDGGAGARGTTGSAAAAAGPSAGVPLAAAPADPLLADLSLRLGQRGLRCAPGRDVPDLVVLPARGDDPALAVVTDISVGDVRHRELVLPATLERFGWVPVPVGALELFRDPAGVARRVAKAVPGASGVLGSGGSGTPGASGSHSTRGSRG